VVGETMSVLRHIACCVETIVYHDYCQLEEGRGCNGETLGILMGLYGIIMIKYIKMQTG
jgi:hypothetical protein